MREQITRIERQTIRVERQILRIERQLETISGQTDSISDSVNTIKNKLSKIIGKLNQRFPQPESSWRGIECGKSGWETTNDEFQINIGKVFSSIGRFDLVKTRIEEIWRRLERSIDKIDFIKVGTGFIRR